MPSTVQRLTFAQLEALWINNGGNRSIAPVMAAIALAESSGIPTNTNPHDNNGRQTSWGLWQISDGTHNMPSPNILDPNANAKAAVAKYRVQGLSAWGTYTSGAYRQYLQNGVKPDNNVPSGGSTSVANQASLTGDLGGAIGQGFADAFKAVLQPFISTFIWGGEIVVGLGMMVGAAIVFVMATQTGQKVASEAGTAATVAVPELGLASSAGRASFVRQMAAQRAQTFASRRKARDEMAGSEERIQRQQRRIRERREAQRRESGKRKSGNSQS